MAVDPGRRRLASAAALLDVALPVALRAVALAGCGGGSAHSSSTATSANAASLSASTTMTSSSTATHATHTRTGHHKRKTTHASTSTTTSTTSATSGGVSTAPPPTPAGTPAAPDGLRQVTGYGSYDLCAGQCTGTVPASLRRALHLPHGCPATGGSSPVHPSGTPDVNATNFIGSAWKAGRVEWLASGSYQGPVLIRGARTDGTGAVGFGEGHVPDDELQLLQSGQQVPRPAGGGRAWLSFTRVRAPGCYAYQIDGTNFSRVIAFRAR